MLVLQLFKVFQILTSQSNPFRSIASHGDSALQTGAMLESLLSSDKNRFDLWSCKHLVVHKHRQVVIESRDLNVVLTSLRLQVSTKSLAKRKDASIWWLCPD